MNNIVFDLFIILFHHDIDANKLMLKVTAITNVGTRRGTASRGPQARHQP